MIEMANLNNWVVGMLERNHRRFKCLCVLCEKRVGWLTPEQASEYMKRTGELMICEACFVRNKDIIERVIPYDRENKSLEA
jgi:hypothetical protein